MSAFDELRAFLYDGEAVEGIIFGAYGWGGRPSIGEAWELTYEEKEFEPIPVDKRGKVMVLEEAEPFMQDWNIAGDYGSPDCYAMYVWTNLRVIWISQYDGATCLSSAPRHPVNIIPIMPGG